jgi:hypothetical protein
MKYQNGKIYKITDNAYTKMYIGSTTQSLSRRFSKHKFSYKSWQNGGYDKVSVFDLFNEFGIENCKIELIEAYPCNNRDELEKKEGELIRANICINKLIVGRSHREYYIEHKNDILAHMLQKIQCECGCEVSHCHIARHKRTQKHLNNI